MAAGLGYPSTGVPSARALLSDGRASETFEEPPRRDPQGGRATTVKQEMVLTIPGCGPPLPQTTLLPESPPMNLPPLKHL